MRVRNDTVWALALLLLSAVSCTDSASPAKSDNSDSSSAGSDDGDGTADDGSSAAVAPDGGKGTTSAGGKPTNTTTVKRDGGVGSAGPDASLTPPSGTDPAVATTSDGGAAPMGDSGSAPVTAPVIPMPMAAPLVWGFGIGITDVPAASKFYTEVMKMTVEKDAIKRDDRTETTLYGTQAKRGARLVLMKFDDMRNTRKITAKLVFQAQDASAVDAAASKYPDYMSRLNLGIVQFDGPETYIHEVGGVFDDGGAGISVPYPIALGFATSDLTKSRTFYKSLGMTESSVGSFSVTDINGTATITEYSVKFADGMGLVLQQWSTPRNAKDNPIMAVIFVPDAKAMADKIVAGGGSIVKPAERSAAYDNRLLVVAKDLDGYVLEIVE